jgi:hypothetical protein
MMVKLVNNTQNQSVYPSPIIAGYPAKAYSFVMLLADLVHKHVTKSDVSLNRVILPDIWFRIGWLTPVVP